MRPRITLLTIGVEDLERSLAFYRDGLGFPTKGIVGTEFEHGAVVFFDLGSGLKLALYPRKDIAHEAKVPQGPRSSTEFAVGHNVASREEVDSVVADAAKAGAAITDPPHATFWGGYAGTFADPDGHLWEVAWNPQMMPEE
jgi:catechol 2,3-dioxygenase-like lactoylglutathione lyase family enzyme